MPLPQYYLEVTLSGSMASVIAVMMYRGGFLKELFESFSKGPGGFPMYSSLQVRSPHWNQYMTLILLTMGSLSFWETSRFLMVLLPLKWVSIPYLPTDFSNAFTETLGVWYYYVTLGFNFIGNRLGACSVLALSPIINLTG